jgi:hypothetical protein
VVVWAAFVLGGVWEQWRSGESGLINVEEISGKR